MRPGVQVIKYIFSLAELADKINRSNSGPSHHNFTLAELISNVAEVFIWLFSLQYFEPMSVKEG